MKFRSTAIAAVLGVSLAACNGSTEAPAEPITIEDLDTIDKKASYLIGYRNAADMTESGIIVDRDVMDAAIAAALDGAEPLIDDAGAQQVFRELQRILQDRELERRKEEYAPRLAAAEAFLEENKSKEGVLTTESGLQYKVVREGTGAQPTIIDTVRVDYEGKLLDGTIFDSSYERGEPLEFDTGGVIPGWTEALQLMKVGSEFEVYIHPDLGYGLRGAGAGIGPQELLIFKVELLDIVDPDAPADEAAQ